MKDINQFLMFDVLKINEDWQKWSVDLDRETTTEILDQAQDFAKNVLWPLNAVGDKESCRLENGNVFTPTGFKDAYDQFCSLGWNAIDISEENGGQNLPNTLSSLINLIFSGNNMSFSMYPGLTHGAYNVLNKFGTEDVRKKLIPSMVSGKFSGTMCLTEPQCGSDLSLIKSKATPTGQSSFGMQEYVISGTKIFISSGDHDLTDNILHLVLAKTDLEAPGTKGISLFLVPKFNLDESGNALKDQRNGVDCIAIEHKMGIKGSATCQLNFNKSKGYLIGKENMGLAYMFEMMNEARLLVGVQGLSLTEKAYELSLAYAKERVAGKSLISSRMASETHSLIINHPDVRKMLLRQYSRLVAGKFLALWTAHQLDVIKYSKENYDISKANALIALFTPIVKSFLTDNSVLTTNEAIQVLGGHGYLNDYGIEQLARDARITPIYEGTNTIQAMDLLARKILGKSSKDFMTLAQSLGEELESFVDDVNEKEAAYIAKVLEALDSLSKTSFTVFSKLEKNPAIISAIAKDYLDVLGYILFGYAWIKILRNTEDTSMTLAADFFFNQEFCMTKLYIERIGASQKSVLTHDFLAE